MANVTAEVANGTDTARMASVKTRVATGRDTAEVAAGTVDEVAKVTAEVASGTVGETAGLASETSIDLEPPFMGKNPGGSRVQRVAINQECCMGDPNCVN